MVYLLYNTKHKCWVGKNGTRAKDINNARAWNRLKDIRKVVRGIGWKHLQINKLSISGVYWTLIRRRPS